MDKKLPIIIISLASAHFQLWLYTGECGVSITTGDGANAKLQVPSAVTNEKERGFPRSVSTLYKVSKNL